MRSGRVFISDVVLIAGYAVLLYMAIRGSRTYRAERTDRATALSWLPLVAIAALSVWQSSRAIEVIGGDRFGLYPDQPRVVLLGTFVAGAIAAVAVADSVVSRMRQVILWRSQRSERSLTRRGLAFWEAALVLATFGAIGVVLSVLGPGEDTSTKVSASNGSVAIEADGSEIALVGFTAAPDEAPVLASLMPITQPRAFSFPIFLAGAPEDDRLFVVELAGEIRVVIDGLVRPEPMLDIRDLVMMEGEGGMLGLAFHPEYATNGRLFVYYTDLNLNQILAEYRADPESAIVIGNETARLLDVPRSSAEHFGGMLQFGPDGYLYVSIGDGHEAIGPDHVSQDPGRIRGSILRLDVDSAQPYSIPMGNAIDDDGEPTEVWAYGLRNPWRFWIDEMSGTMVIGDVGEVSFEEMNVAFLDQQEQNFGWPIMEGSVCSMDVPCDPTGMILPTVEYPRKVGCAVIGGPVYRGSLLPILGETFYADFCSGWVRSFLFEGDQVVTHRIWAAAPEAVDIFRGNIVSFGVDREGEIYLLTVGNLGLVYKLVPQS